MKTTTLDWMRKNSITVIVNKPIFAKTTASRETDIAFLADWLAEKQLKNPEQFKERLVRRWKIELSKKPVEEISRYVERAYSEA